MKSHFGTLGIVESHRLSPFATNFLYYQHHLLQATFIMSARFVWENHFTDGCYGLTSEKSGQWPILLILLGPKCGQ